MTESPSPQFRCAVCNQLSNYQAAQSITYCSDGCRAKAVERKRQLVEAFAQQKAEAAKTPLSAESAPMWEI